MNQIKLGLNHKNAGQRIAQGNAIKSALTDNPDFPLPNPPLPALDSALATLEAKLTERLLAIEAAKAATEALRAAEAAYDALITQLAAYALSAVAGDAAKLERGGFSLRREGSPTRELDQVQDLRVEADGFAGGLKLRWEPVRGAKVYQVQLSPDVPTETSWTTVQPSPSSSMTLDGLESGQRIWIQVRGVARGVVGPWSQPANRTVP
jgi:hypothetical protein